jgi:hypothetical protein
MIEELLIVARAIVQTNRQSIDSSTAKRLI